VHLVARGLDEEVIDERAVPAQRLRADAGAVPQPLARRPA